MTAVLGYLVLVAACGAEPRLWLAAALGLAVALLVGEVKS